MFSVDIEGDQWHEMGEGFTIHNIFTSIHFWTFVGIGIFFVNNKENTIFPITNLPLLKLH